MKKLISVLLASSIILTQVPAFAATQARQDSRRVSQPARSASDFQGSYLRTVRLLQYKQQLERLQEEVNSEVKRNVQSNTPSDNSKENHSDIAAFPFDENYPNDPYFYSSGSWYQSFGDLWGVKKIGLDSSVWNRYRGQGIKIAVVDTGVIATHEDIADNIWNNPLEIAGNGLDDDNDGYVDDVSGWDFVEGDNTPTDLNGHGTHVAGIAAASGNNSKGIIGVAPLAKIIPVRVLDQYGSGTVEAVAKGIEYAAKVGANIINISLGAMDLDFDSISLFQEAVNFAKNLGCIIVAAAGNQNSDINNFSPANIDGVISVAATDSYDNRAGFSNYGSKLFISAPGVDILSLGSVDANIGSWWVSTDYYVATGTSMATPFVSGAVALLLNKYPGASIDFIKSRLTAGAVDLGEVGWDPYYGNGLLNIANSLKFTSAVAGGERNSSQAAFSSNDFLFRLIQRKRDEKLFFIPRKLDLGGGRSITVDPNLIN